MKTLLIFVLGLIAGLILTYGLCAAGNLPFSCDSEGNLIDSTGNVVVIDTNVAQEVIVDPAIANDLTNKYSTEYITDDAKRVTGYQGGRIDLSSLRAVLAQVTGEQTHINYRFGFSNEIIPHTSTALSYGPTEGVLYLFLSAGNFNSGTTSTDKIIVKNGYLSESFCPYTCD